MKDSYRRKKMKKYLRWWC